MTNKRILFLIIFILLASKHAKSQPQCEQVTSETTRIYFANGMSNDRPSADNSMAHVGKLLNWSSNYRFDTSYNYSKNWLTQLLQAYEQKKEEQQLAVEPEEYWYWLRNMDEAPEWFRKVYQQNLQQFHESSVYNDPYLMQHVNNYTLDIYKTSKSTNIGFPIDELS